MLPKRIRFWLFETLSVETMRYVQAIPRRKATGLVARVYDMIEEDFSSMVRSPVARRYPRRKYERTYGGFSRMRE